MSCASLSSSGPRSWRTPSSVAPSTYSIDTSSRPSTSIRSKIRQTLGDTTSRAARTSCAQQLEPAVRLEELLPQRLQRHLDPQLEVEGVPHLAHPATAEHLENLVALAQHLPRREAPHPLRHVEGRALVLGAGQRSSRSGGAFPFMIDSRALR